jgi:hypothetical protein
LFYSKEARKHWCSNSRKARLPPPDSNFLQPAPLQSTANAGVLVAVLERSLVDAIPSRDPGARSRPLQLLRVVEAYQAIQRRMARVGNNSNEIPKLANAIKVLDGLRNCHSKTSP